MLEAAVLVGCCHGPRYGYELSRWLADEGLVAGPVSSGRLYETLADLVDHGALVVTAELSDRGPSQRHYQITSLGGARLARWVTSLEHSAVVLARLLAHAALIDSSVGHSEGGNAMSCRCQCGGPKGRCHESHEVKASATPARSVEERLEAIEGLLERLNSR
jgi:DNA-binding PadR family transcriptional regulator